MLWANMSLMGCFRHFFVLFTMYFTMFVRKTAWITWRQCHIMRTNKMNENQWTNSNKSNAPSILDHINNEKFHKTKTTYIYNSKNMKNVAFLRFKNHVYMCAVPANVNTLHRHAHLPPLIFWYIAKSNSGLGCNFVTMCMRSDLLILLFHLCVRFFCSSLYHFVVSLAVCQYRKCIYHMKYLCRQKKRKTRIFWHCKIGNIL